MSARYCGGWGVFNVEQDVHVAPAFKDGTLVKPHELVRTCICRPKVSDSISLEAGAGMMWVHVERPPLGFGLPDTSDSA